MENIDDIEGVLDTRYHLVRKVGSGGTSKVYLGYLKEKKDVFYAFKVLNPEIHDAQLLKNEAEMLQKISGKSENVVRLIDSGEGFFKKSDGRSNYRFYLVLEYVSNGELFDFIYLTGRGFGEVLGRHIFILLLEALEACHKEGIVHRDLKPENIMVDDHFCLKIADFGFATHKYGKDGKGLLYTCLGTNRYAAPELLVNEAYYGECNDIYSLAVCLFVIITGSMPFKVATKDCPFYSYIMNYDYEGYWNKRGNSLKVSILFKELFNNLVAFDPFQRPTIEEIKAHPWTKLGYLSIEQDSILLKQEFTKRKLIIDHKKMKELIAQQNNNINPINFGGQIYRSSKDDIQYTQNITRTLRDYKPNDNRYVVVFTKNNNENSIFNHVIDFFTGKGKIETNNNYYSVKVILEQDELNNINEECNYFEHMQNLVFKIQIKNYVNDQFIVEFNKKIGDRFKFLELFKSYVDSIN